MTLKTFVAISVAALLMAWYWSSTKAEREFIFNVQLEIERGANELDLPKLMKGNWETVCSIHGYDGPTYIKKYDRTYSPAGAAQDGVWGLTFISQDGSYESAAGSRKNGFNFDFGCLDRDDAKLVRKTENEVMWVPHIGKGS